MPFPQKRVSGEIPRKLGLWLGRKKGSQVVHCAGILAWLLTKVSIRVQSERVHFPPHVPQIFRLFLLPH